MTFSYYKRALSLLSIAVFCVGCSVNQETAKFVGKPAPYAKYTALDGSQDIIGRYKGKPLVLVFWATTCSYSHKVMDQLQLLSERSNDRVNFIALSLDRNDALDDLKRNIVGKGLKGFRHAFSGNEGLDEAFRAFRADSHPLVILIDRKGTVLSVSNNAHDVQKYLEENIQLKPAS